MTGVCAVIVCVASAAFVGACGNDAPSYGDTAAQDAAGGSCAVSPGADGSPADGSARADGSEGADGSAADAASDTEITGRTEIGTFAAGCFWGVEARFAAIPGVVNAVVGYTGGTTRNPTYKEVCSKTTGHAEAVRVEYDPDVVSYERLVEAFFEMHDPTTQDRQGPDVGDQYRSAIFFHTPSQEAIAQRVRDRLDRSGTYLQPIVTEIAPAGTFWRAEAYHQDYYSGQSSQS